MPSKKPSAKPSPERTGRREFLKRAGIVTTLSLAGAYALDVGGIRSSISDTTDHEREGYEKIDGYKFRLGQFDFVISSEHYEEDEARRLEENIREVYKKLEDYFGKEVLEANNLQQVVIKTLGSGAGEKAGSVVHHFMQEEQDGKAVGVRLPTSHTLKLSKIDDLRLIAHEFFHLAVQWNMPAQSEAFQEGHAEVLTDELGLERESNNIFLELPELDDMLSKDGWDLSAKEEGVLDKTVQMNEIVLITLREKWRRDWLKLIKKDPDFLKKFYRKIAEYKRDKNSKPILEYNGLLDLAQSIYPGFKKWRDTEGISTKLPEHNRPSEIFLGKMTGRNTMQVFSFSTARTKEARTNKISYGNVTSKFKIYGLYENGKVGSVDIDLKATLPFIQPIEFTDGLLPKLIIFGDRQIPVIPLQAKSKDLSR